MAAFEKPSVFLEHWDMVGKKSSKEIAEDKVEVRHLAPCVDDDLKALDKGIDGGEILGGR